MTVNRSRRAKAARKRKRRMDGVEHDLSAAEWSALQDAWGGCAYCGVPHAPRPVPIVLGRGVRLWDGLETVESDYAVEAVSSPSGVTNLTLTRRATA